MTFAALPHICTPVPCGRGDGFALRDAAFLLYGRLPKGRSLGDHRSGPGHCISEPFWPLCSKSSGHTGSRCRSSRVSADSPPRQAVA